MKEGSIPHRFLLVLAKSYDGLGTQALFEKVGGNRSSLKVELARFIRSGHLKSININPDAPNNQERVVYRVTEYGRSVLLDVTPECLNEDDDGFPIRPVPDGLAVASTTPVSVWDLARVPFIWLE